MKLLQKLQKFAKTFASSLSQFRRVHCAGGVDVTSHMTSRMQSENN